MLYSFSHIDNKNTIIILKFPSIIAFDINVIKCCLHSWMKCLSYPRRLHGSNYCSDLNVSYCTMSIVQNKKSCLNSLRRPQLDPCTSWKNRNFCFFVVNLLFIQEFLYVFGMCKELFQLLESFVLSEIAELAMRKWSCNFLPKISNSVVSVLTT